MKSQWKLILRLSISLVLIGLVLFFVDFRELVKILVNLNPWYLPTFVALIYLDRALMAYKWGLLQQAVDVRVPFSFLFQIYTIAPLSGILLPSTLGGDIFRLYSLSRHKVNTKAVFASIIVERITGLVAMLILVAISLGLAFYLMGDSWNNFRGMVWALVVIAVIAAGLIGVMHSFFRGYVDKLAGRFTKYPIAGKLHQVYTLSCEYKNHLRTVGIVSAWTFLEQMVPIVGNFLMVKALHIDVSFLKLVVIIPITVLAIRLPISLDGIGVKEGLYVALFGMAGVSASEAFLLAMLGRVLPLLCVLPWGIYYIIRGHQRILPEQQITSVGPQ